MKKFKSIIFAPLYHIGIAIYFPICFYINNLYLFQLSDVLTIILTLIAFSISISFIFKIFITTEKSTIVTFLLLIILLSPSLSFNSGFYLSIFAISLIILVLKSNPSKHLNIILNIFILCLLIYPGNRLISLSKLKNMAPDAYSRKLINLETKPDIYHFVLDGYSSERALKDFYDFDNSYFINQLKSRGFTVYNDAISPYNWTLPILSSIFNLDYAVDNKSDKVKLPIGLQMYQWGTAPYHGIVPRYLFNNGYHFAFSSNGYTLISLPNKYNIENIDTNRNGYINVFFYEFLRNLWWSEKIIDFNKINITYHSTIKAFNFKNYAKIKRPFFYYSHILSPHPPFNINKHGDITNKYIHFKDSINDGSHATNMEQRLINEYRKGYIEKLIFTNHAMLEQLDFIINHMNGKKIIIIHGDHGGGASMNYDEFNPNCVMERFKPLLAIYKSWDTPNLREVSTPYSLINIYRDILPQISENTFSPLPPKTFFIPWGKPENITEFNISSQTQK